MNYYRYIAWILVIVPVIIFGFAFYVAPEKITGSEALSISLILGLLGVAFSYFSLVFAAYAALQVQAISDLYFFKIRSPAVLKKLNKISNDVLKFKDEPAVDLQAQRFMSEAIVVYRSAKRINNKQVKEVAEQAERCLEALQASIKSVNLAQRSAGQLPKYWEFYQKTSELVDEMKTQIEETRALP